MKKDYEFARRNPTKEEIAAYEEGFRDGQRSVKEWALVAEERKAKFFAQTKEIEKDIRDRELSAKFRIAFLAACLLAWGLYLFRNVILHL